MSDRQQFLVFPHIDAGFKAMNNDNFEKATREFLQALKFAPNSVVLIGYLAQAQVSEGRLAEAIQTLDLGIKLEPNNQKLLNSKREFSRQIAINLIDQAKTLFDQPIELRARIKAQTPTLDTPFLEASWLEVLTKASTPQDNLLKAYVVKFPQNENDKKRLLLNMYLSNRDFVQANQMIDKWPVGSDNLSDISNLSFQLLRDGYANETLRLLTRAYPFNDMSRTQQQLLVQRMQLAAKQATDKQVLKTWLARWKNKSTTPQQEKDWLALATVDNNETLDDLLGYRARYPENRGLITADIARRIVAGEPLPKNMVWQPILEPFTAADFSLLDTLTFRMIEIGDLKSAWSLLMTNFPFAQAPLAIQTTLLERMLVITKRAPRLMTASDLKHISTHPLSTALFRQLQATLLSSANDCQGVRRVLGDLSDQYSASNWVMLGDCYDKIQKPGLAQFAFEKAFQLSPKPSTERAIAYIAFQNKDYALALQSWVNVAKTGDLNNADRLAAATTAKAASNLTLAAQFLTQYEQNQGALSAAYWSLKAELVAPNDPSGAIVAMKQAISLEPTAERYLLLAKWQQATRDNPAALVSLNRAVKLAPDNGQAQADLGFLYYQEADLEPARTHLAAALALRPHDPQLVEQLAYTNQRLANNPAAKEYIQLSVDHLLLFPQDELDDERQKRLFSLRRMNEELSRRWTLSVDALTGTGSSASVQSPEPGANYKSYSQIEFDYRLGEEPIRNGKTLSVYARVFGGGGVDNSPAPVYAPTLGVGIRWKPFTSQVIYLAAEQQTPLDNGTSPESNTMLRVSASFFNVGQYSDDWHPVRSNWVSTNLYLDSAYYLRNQAWALTADYKIAYHHKLQTAAQTVGPYARLIANKISTETTPDIRVGLGVQWNIWSDASRYSAFKNRYTVGLEIQQALQTYQTDKFSALLTLGLRW